jgi:hypothetical protein
MSVWEKLSCNLLTLVVAASGTAYFVMKDVMESGDPFSLVNHPWQPAMLAIHILASPLLILMFGVILHSHVARKIYNGDGNGNGRNRRSGALALMSFGLMIGSGYALQVTTGATPHRIALLTHLASSAIFVASYLAHLVISVRLARTRGEQAVAAAATTP